VAVCSANAQTGNVIFFAVSLATRHWVHALTFVWPILSFIAGIALSSYLKSGRVRVLRHPLRWAMAVQATVLAVIGFVPAWVRP